MRWIALLLLLLTSAARADDTWAYVTAFRSGAVWVVDVQGSRLVRAIPVEDRDGMIGLCVTTDGRRLVIVDGNGRSRVRILDAFSGHALGEFPFADRRLRPAGLPVAALSSDDHFLFVETRSGARALDLRSGKFRALSVPGCRAPEFLSGAFALCHGALWRLSSTFVPRTRAALTIGRVAAAVALRNGTRMFAVAAVPPMRKLPPTKPMPTPLPGHPTPQPSPTPNPALREGPWRMAAWTGEGAPRVIDLIKQVDVEKLSEPGLPSLAASPDNAWIALSYGRRAWILHPDTLAVQWEIYPPGPVNGAAFSADSQDLLTVQDGSLLHIRLANRGYKVIARGALRTVRPPVVVAGPKPPGPQL